MQEFFTCPYNTARAASLTAAAARAAAEVAEAEAKERVHSAERATSRGRTELDDMRRREREELEGLRRDADAKLQVRPGSFGNITYHVAIWVL